MWDIAAGKIIVEEAGGQLNKMGNLKINKIDIKAGNPNIYEKMVKILITFNCFLEFFFVIRLAMKKKYSS